MTVKDLETLYDYDSWANGKLFAVISQLTPEQFTRTVVTRITRADPSGGHG